MRQNEKLCIKHVCLIIFAHDCRIQGILQDVDFSDAKVLPFGYVNVKSDLSPQLV